MFCSQCGSSVSPSVRFCSSCGASTSSSVNGSSTSVPQIATHSLAQTKSKFWTKKNIALILLSALIGIAITTYLRSGSNLLNGEVTVDANKVETTIHDGVLEQSGEEVTVECPSTLAGKPGDTRNCLVTDSTGAIYFAVVTFESKKGDISWVLDTQQ